MTEFRRATRKWWQQIVYNRTINETLRHVTAQQGFEWICYTLQIIWWIFQLPWTIPKELQQYNLVTLKQRNKLVANGLTMLLKMLNKLDAKARYVWQQATTRTASENKDKLQNILSQKVIVTKHYANI